MQKFQNKIFPLFFAELELNLKNQTWLKWLKEVIIWCLKRILWKKYHHWPQNMINCWDEKSLTTPWEKAEVFSWKTISHKVYSYVGRQTFIWPLWDVVFHENILTFSAFPKGKCMYPDYNIASMVISYNILTDYLVYRDPYRIFRNKKVTGDTNIIKKWPLFDPPLS